MTVHLTAAKVRDARARPVTHIEGSLFRVDGNPALGEDGLYWSVRMEADGSHDCSCYLPPDTLAGRTQREFGCKHAAAVHIYRARHAVIARRAAAHAAAVDLATTPTPSPKEGRFHPPGEEPFPEWVQGFRRTQWDAIERVMEAFDAGASVVMLQAPVGSGKTLAGETVRRLVGGRGLYVCSTKSLQDQAARDFPYAAVLKGRSNYPTLRGDGATVDAWGRAGASPGAAAGAGQGKGVTAADCTAVGGSKTCRFCDPAARCPYRLARDMAIASRLAILNTSYFLTDANKGGRRFADRDLAIIDEADLLEGELLNQVEVNISAHRMKRLAMASPAKKTVESSWIEWVTAEAIPKVKRRLGQLPPPEDASTAELRERKSLRELLERLETLELELPSGGWVYDGYRNGGVIFRPIEVGPWGRRMLWPHAKRFLLMSGSIISADEMASSLGLDGDYRLVDVPMTFPAENRPVNVVALAEVTAKNQEQSWPRIVEGVVGVLAEHPDDRVLVHTVSYPFATFIRDRLLERGVRRPLVTYDNARDRDTALALYKRTPGAVLLAPSMDRGIDLPGDLCRVQVIAKIPFPNLGDKRTNARLYGTPGGGAWYAVNTVRTLIQMTGRGVRSADDHAVTYILDHNFTTNLWRKHKSLLPGWWCEAVDWHYPVHRLLRAARAATN